MANAIVEIVAPSGMTLTLSLFPIGSDTAGATGKALTERTNDKGTYRATVADGLVGLYRANALTAGGVLVAKGVVLMSDEATDHYVVVESNVRLIGGASTIIDGKTITEALQIISAACAGKVSGAGTGEETFKGLDGTTTRIVVTCDPSGNRSAVTY